MSRPRKGGAIAAVLSFTLVSRAIGFLREMIIAAGFGFSPSTDAFYQLAAAPTYLITYVSGPFATSYIAWVNGENAPDERLCRAYTLKLLLLCTSVLAVGMAAVTLWLASGNPALRPFGIPQVLMAASCITVGLVAFSSTVANARGRFVLAQSILFANNISFVLLLGMGALVFRHSVLLALTTAFAAAGVVAAIYGMRYPVAGAEASDVELANGPEARAALIKSVRQRFAPLLGYASIETIGFLATQAIVLTLASSSGVGVASAGSLAQRIALTTNGLVINPLSSVAMVRLSKLPEHERRGFLVRIATMTLAGLAAVAAVLSLSTGLLTHFTHSPNAALLARLIPSYSLWLVAQGGNTILSRLSFARGAVRLYTGITVSGYVLANAGRYLVWRHWGFGPAIATGAATELAAALIILVVLAFRAERRPAPVITETTALLAIEGPSELPVQSI